MITKRLAHVNSSEVYNGKIVLQGDRLFIPVVNVGLMDGHALNKPGSGQLFVDRSYLVFKGLKSGVYNDDSAWAPQDDTGLDRVFHFGAENLFDPGFFELKIVYGTGELLILEDSRFSRQQWTPISTPNFPQNMEEHQVLPFLRNELFETVRDKV